MGWRTWVRGRGHVHEARHSPLPESEYRRDVQGLRAVAVLIVVLDHAGISYLSGGYVGVDVFFVLSGFLITGVLLSGVEKLGYLSFVDFYIRRAKRILPAATLTLVATIIASYFLLNVVRARQATWDSLWASLFGANVHLSQQGTDYFARGQPPSPIQHFWSLSVEEQFYFVWPALLALTLFGLTLGARAGSRRRRGGQPVIARMAHARLGAVAFAAVGASLVWSIAQTDTAPTAAYFSTLTRAWELGLGALLAIAGVHVSRLPAGLQSILGWLGLGAIAAAAVTYSSTTAFPGYAALLPTVGAALVIAGGVSPASARRGAGRLLSTAPMRYVGDRSYAFYLWHWPVLIIASQYAGYDLSVGVNLALVAGAFALSMVSYALVENPIRRSHWSPSATGTLVPASVAAVAVAAMFALNALDAKVLDVTDVAVAAAPVAPVRMPAAVSSTQGAPLPGVAAAVAAARRGAKLPSGLTPPPDRLLDPDYLYFFPDGCVPVTDQQTRSDICRLGDASAKKTIVVFGDSHAQMWMPTVLAMAERDGWAVVPLVKSGCNPSLWKGKGYPGTPASAVRQCHAWYAWASQKAKALRADVVLMAGCCSGAVEATADATILAYTSLAAAVRRTAKSVIALADAEGVHQQPVDCLLGRKASMKTCTTTWNNVHFALNDDIAAVAKKRGFGFLATRGWFCVKYECPMVVGRTVVYRDTGHITRPYALGLVPPFRAAFRRCVLDSCPS
jgi:peptidoglycan/LPS O-acetylase OafA/YrhL